MNKAGGIAYLLKHGRAPLPAVTRTTQPRRGSVSVRGYAEGGTTSANLPLNYESVPNYEYTPSSQNIAPHYELGPDGKLVYVPGRYASGMYGGATRPVAGPAVGTAATTAPAREKGPQMAVDTSIYGGGGYNGDGGLNPGAPGAYADTTSGLARAVAAMVNASPLASLAGWADKKASEAGINVPGMIDGSTVAKSPGMTEADKAGFIAGQRAVQQANMEAAAREASAAAAAAASSAQAERDDAAAVDRGMTEGSNDASPGGVGEARGGLNIGGEYYPHMAAGGIAALAGGGHAQGPRLLSGGGTGLSDDIPAVIGHNQPARLADGEFVVSADVVSALGGGSTKAGAKKLYDMMDRIRKQAHGTKKQVKKVNDRKVLPA